MFDYYILDENNKPVLEPDDEKSFKWRSDYLHKIVSRTSFPSGTRISTVFLCLDHGWESGPPVLWETMVFGGEFSNDQERYTSHDDAVKGHIEWVKKVLKSENLLDKPAEV